MKFLIAAVILSAAVTACADRTDTAGNVPAPAKVDKKGTGFCEGVNLKPGERCP